MENSFSFSFSGRVELLKYVYFYAQKSIIKAGNNKFQDLINVPRTYSITITQYYNILQFFMAVKMIVFRLHFLYFSYFCSKHRLWVHVRTGSNDVSTICVLEQKYEKNVYPCKPKFYYIKKGLKGCKLHGRVSMINRLNEYGKQTSSFQEGGPAIFAFVIICTQKKKKAPKLKPIAMQQREQCHKYRL